MTLCANFGARAIIGVYDPYVRSRCLVGVLLAVGQLLVGTGKRCYVTLDMATEAQLQAPSGSDQPSGEVDQFLNNGLDSSSLGRVANNPGRLHELEI